MRLQDPLEGAHGDPDLRGNRAPGPVDDHTGRLRTGQREQLRDNASGMRWCAGRPGLVGQQAFAASLAIALLPVTDCRLTDAGLAGRVLHAEALGREQDDAGRKICLSGRARSPAIPASCDSAASSRRTQIVWAIAQTRTNHAPREFSDSVIALAELPIGKIARPSEARQEPTLAPCFRARSARCSAARALQPCHNICRSQLVRLHPTSDCGRGCEATPVVAP